MGATHPWGIYNEDQFSFLFFLFISEFYISFYAILDMTIILAIKSYSKNWFQLTSYNLKQRFVMSLFSSALMIHLQGASESGLFTNHFATSSTAGASMHSRWGQWICSVNADCGYTGQLLSRRAPLKRTDGSIRNMEESVCRVQ